MHRGQHQMASVRKRDQARTPIPGHLLHSLMLVLSLPE